MFGQFEVNAVCCAVYVLTCHYCVAKARHSCCLCSVYRIESLWLLVVRQDNLFDCVVKMEDKIKLEGNWEDYAKGAMNRNKNASLEEFHKAQMDGIRFPDDIPGELRAFEL